MIIDDYPINLRIAEMVIKRNGFFNEVTSYSEAEKALAFLTINQKSEKHLPDVILLDLQMPVMDGWQFLDKFEELRGSLCKRIHVFILSSSLNELDIKKANEYPSVSRFLSKPLSESMLQGILAEVKLASVS